MNRKRLFVLKFINHFYDVKNKCFLPPEISGSRRRVRLPFLIPGSKSCASSVGVFGAEDQIVITKVT